MDKVIKVILLMNNQILISQIEEKPSELGEPDCKLIEPFIVNGEELSPWLMNLTIQNDFMISSDKVLTIVVPNSKLKTKYEDLLK